MDYDFSKIKTYINSNKSILNILKLIIISLSLYFVVNLVINNIQQLIELSLSNYSHIIVFVLISSFFYTVLLIVLALGWKKILENINNKTLDHSIVIIYLKSLIYKYLPGNIFHYANRQISAKKIGVSHNDLLKSNVFEAINLIFAASIFSLILFKQHDSSSVFYWIITLLTIIGLITLLIYRKKKFSKTILFTISYYLIYFIGIGGLSYYCLNTFTDNNLNLLNCIAIYSLAWIAGFIIPGAPGGIGIRESVFILLSDNIISQPEALFVITLLRLVTTLGEIIAYLLAQFSYHYHLNDTAN